MNANSWRSDVDGGESRPFLHVLIPAYGESPFLAEAVRSVLAADGERMRVTVVDDGTPGPAVRDICRDVGVEYQRLPQNVGVARAFQACVERSAGDYTLIMGSDDLMGRDYPAVVGDLVRRYGEPELATPSVGVIDAAGRPVRPLPDRVKGLLAPRGDHQLVQGDRLVARLLAGNWLYFPAIAWRTDVLKRYGFRGDLETAVDLDLELRIFFDGGTLAWTPAEAFGYRRHGGSVSSRSAFAGDRFGEERAVCRWAADRASELHWWRSRLSARLRVTSRMHRAVAWAARGRGRLSPPW